MRKQIIVLSMSLFTMTLFAQKNELKDAGKAIKKEEFAEAVKFINAAEGLMGQMKEKQKAEFYFLKAQAYAGQKEYKMAADAFNTLIAYEKEIDKVKYTDEARPMLNALVNEVSTKAIKAYNEDKDYKTATENFYLTYVLSPTDTSFLFNAAVSASIAKDFETSLSYYRELKSIGYTGISTMYMATDAATGEVENLGSKTQRDLMVKSGKYTAPVDEVSDSKSADIVKNIGYILTQQGKVDEALIAIKEARAQSPKDLNLLLTAADLYIKLERMDKFGELMAEAIELDPNNPILFFNLGVVNFNEGKVAAATKYYKKAIELNPNYADAYTNLGVVLIDGEKAIVEQMNKNLSNFKKYDALDAKRKQIYKDALPYFEKADSIKRTANTVRDLLSVYQNLVIDDKVKEYKAIYEKLTNE